MTRRNRIAWCLALVAASLVLVAGRSTAEWKLYAQGGIGLSGIEIDTHGLADTTPDVPINGRDHDTSPLLDATFGIEVPMDELVPREFLLKVRLPKWTVRSEVEAAGLREWETSTDVNGESFFSEIKSTTVMFNQWLDVPAIAPYSLIQYMFGLGRQPNVRRLLEPVSIYSGLGVGLAPQMDVDGTSNVIAIHDDPIAFAWNAGIGLNFAVNPKTAFSVGYRYLDILAPAAAVQGSTTPGFKFHYDLDVHELRVALRYRFFEFASPWR